MRLRGRGPFGLFERRSTLSPVTRTLIYPEVRRVERLELLDRRLTPEVPRPRPGLGYEVLGIRPYRSGDSPRHLHWRSMARTGQLMSKEFADEAQPSLSLVLDLFAHPYPVTLSKHTPFEWMLKSALTIADYAYRRGYSVYLRADDTGQPLPAGSLSWQALLQYSARVQPLGTRHLSEVLGPGLMQTFAAVLLPWPDETAEESLYVLKRQGITVMAVLLAPDTFPDGGPSASAFADRLNSNGIMTRYVPFGEDWTTALSEQPEKEVAL